MLVQIWKDNIEICSSYGACRFEKTCFEKNAFKVLSWVWETPDTPQEKREIEQKNIFSCMKSFASYCRRFKLNFKPKKTDFLKNVHWCCPLTFPISLSLSLVFFLAITVNFEKNEKNSKRSFRKSSKHSKSLTESITYWKWFNK